ncbi:hypothetical protein LCGC14_2870760, partial [marine sediment metagenome]
PCSKREAQVESGGLSCMERRLRKRLETEPEPKMGRMVNDGAATVDRLKLLGNGVVPAQAELAFRTLMEMFND